MWVWVSRTTADLVELVGDDVGELFVLMHPNHGDEVDVPGDRVDLADAVDLGDGGGDLGNAVDLGVDQDDGGDHRPTLARGRKCLRNYHRLGD